MKGENHTFIYQEEEGTVQDFESQAKDYDHLNSQYTHVITRKKSNSGK